MRLSDRLEAVLNAACDGKLAGVGYALAADIGCDHGFVSIELVRRGIARRAIASDIGEGPIRSARENISRAGLNGDITTIVADGLKGVEQLRKEDASIGRAELIIISGMGGMLMKKILTEGDEVAHSAKALVLSPQSDLCEFRTFLYENGYSITRESCVKDEGKYYFIISVTPDPAVDSGSLDVRTAKYGRREHFSKESLAMRTELIKRDLDNYKKIAASLEEKLVLSCDTKARLEEIHKEIVLLEGILNEE